MNGAAHARDGRGADAGRVPVAVLGATGMVGQRLVLRLAEHPWFELRSLAASERSVGRPYAEVVRWCLDEPLPEAAAALEVAPCDPGELDGEIAFSALDAAVAGEAERRFADAGFAVFSNARNHRLDPDVPLLVPEVNADHLALVARQAARGASGGFVVANPNCSTTGLALALAPLHRRFEVSGVVVTTLQALSGAGYPGVPALDIADNAVPYIGGEEEKIEAETLKILGGLAPGAEAVEPARFAVSALAHRVAVRDGHLLAVSVSLRGRASPAEVAAALREFRGPAPVPSLPSSPAEPIVIRSEPDRPQPRRDRMAGGGMSVVVGRVRPCPVQGVKFSALVHNTIRGAAGAALQNAELAVAAGLLRARHPAAAAAGGAAGMRWGASSGPTSRPHPG